MKESLIKGSFNHETMLQESQFSNKKFFFFFFFTFASSDPEHQIPPWTYQCNGLDQQILTSWRVQGNEKSGESYK